MSKATTPNDETRKEYRINLTDIRGVGPTTVEKLEKERITSVRELHLLRHRGNPTHHNLEDRSVGSDTLLHLREVGKAVHYSGSDRVEAKHLTGSITDEAQFRSSYVDISTQEESTDDSEDSEPDLPEYTTDELQEALDWSLDESSEGYREQGAFEADVARFIGDSDYSVPLPQGIIQAVVRYRHDAETVESQGDFEDSHGAILVLFGETL